MPFVPDSPATGKFKPDVPEKGNMYTQSAEDIVYSPEGIPLYTSSYGSAPTGATKDVQQALTSTVSLPISAGLGAAKNIAGATQYIGKKLGSDFGDQPVNAINQIEQGINQQTGDVGGVLNTISSGLGQAAPFMVGGGGPMLPSLLRRMATGGATGLLSGYLTPEKTGLTPEQFDEAKNQNLLIQSSLGAGLPLVGKFLGSGINAVKSAIEPLYQGGREKILGRALRDFAGGEEQTAIQNLKNAKTLVPGSLPTVGQAAGVPSLAALERTAFNTPEMTNTLAARKLAQAEAQTSALQNIASPTRVEKYQDLQEKLGEELYVDALKPLSLGKLTNKMQTEIKGLIDRPAISEAMNKAKENAANRGLNIADPAGSMRGLHETKMALDREIKAVKGKLERDQAGSTSAELDSLLTAKKDLLNFMEKISPAYKTARETYARVSKPVEQLASLEKIADKSVSASKDTIKFDTFFKNLKSLKKEGILSDRQVARLEAIGEDMKRVKYAETAGKDVGSDTVQKLAYSNMMNEVGIPNALRNFGPAGVVGNIASRGADVLYGRANKELRSQLAETMLNPQEAARLMEKAQKSSKSLTSEEQRKLAKILLMQSAGQIAQ